MAGNIIDDGNIITVLDGKNDMGFAFHNRLNTVSGSIDRSNLPEPRPAELINFKFLDGQLNIASHISTGGTPYNQIVLTLKDDNRKLPQGYKLPVLETDKNNTHMVFQIENGKITKGSSGDRIASADEIKQAQTAMKDLIKTGLKLIGDNESIPQVKDNPDHKKAADAMKAELAAKLAESELSDKTKILFPVPPTATPKPSQTQHHHAKPQHAK